MKKSPEQSHHTEGKSLEKASMLKEKIKKTGEAGNYDKAKKMLSKKNNWGREEVIEKIENEFSVEAILSHYDSNPEMKKKIHRRYKNA